MPFPLFSRGRKLVFDVVPHVGVLPIKLNAKRDKIRKVMIDLGHGLSASREQLDYYIENSVQVEFDAEDRASFIGIASNREIEVTYRGMRVFKHNAEEVFSFIRECGDEGSGRFDRSEHLFKKQIVTLWDADEQYDIGGGRFPVWGQIGVGNRDYLQFCESLG